MGRKITLYTITGLKARILKLIVGTPILVAGALMLDAGLENPTEPYVLPFIGGIVALGGVVACLSAFTNDELAITLGGGSSFE